MTLSQPTLRLLRNPDATRRTAILEPLLAFNAAQIASRMSEPVAILIERGGIASGGLWGRLTYDWLVVELLVVPEAHRGTGLGRAIIQMAEEVARAERCVGLWLDTFDFQARGFYERLGFIAFGELSDHPRGGRRVFLQKRLDPEPDP